MGPIEKQLSMKDYSSKMRIKIYTVISRYIG